MHTLIKPKKTDKESLNLFVLDKINEDRVLDIKLVWDIAGKRPESAWEAVAIKFYIGLTAETLIQTIVDLHADEYWGMQDGYHIFWFD